MKRITLLLAILLASHMAFAQEEVAIEQNINTSISYLNINAGWNVRLMHRETEGYRIAIVVPKQYEEIAIVDVHVCNINCDTMTINENTLLPRGTVIELEGPMTFGQINLLNNATAEADYVVSSAASVSEKETNLHLRKNASLRVRHFHIPSPENSPSIAVWDHAQLTIDTISGEGDAGVNVFAGADFQYGINALHGKITLSEYDKTGNWPIWPYQQKDVRIIKTKEVDGKLVTTDRRKIWNDALALDGGIGVLQGNTPTDPNSPLLQSTTLSVKLGMTTYFKFSNHWGLSTGILWNHNKKSLCHQVKYENSELVVIDGQEDYQRNRLTNNYLGVPVNLYFYPWKRQTESFSLDFYCARLLGERLFTTTDPTKLFARTSEKVDNIFNPWKLEVGLSFNTQHLGFIHGIRVFTNLLPEYKPEFTTEKIRSIGIEIKL